MQVFSVKNGSTVIIQALSETSADPANQLSTKQSLALGEKGQGMFRQAIAAECFQTGVYRFTSNGADLWWDLGII